MTRIRAILLPLVFGAVAALAAVLSAQSPVDGDALISERVDGCEVCRRMTVDILPGHFYEDAHDFACADCHHPHVKRTTEQWKNTCTSSGCHPRAWTKTVFHRLDPEVFQKCSNCHQPHVWTADGEDCAGCHQDVLQAAEPLMSATLGVEFSHPLHQNLDCSGCHDSSRKHASLVMTSSAQCQDCHHSAQAQAVCADCHDAGIVAQRPVSVSMNASVWPQSRTRDLPFDHANHQGVACEDCHSQPSMAVVADCASCHQQHHGVQANCVTCHTTPTDDAHDRSVHSQATCDGSGCHVRDTATFATEGSQLFPAAENVCRSCHQDLGEHKPGLDCTYCHMLAGEPGGGTR